MENKVESTLLLKKPEVQKKIVELRDSNEYPSWETIRNKFNEEYDSHVSMSALKQSYNKTLATSISVFGPEKDHFKDLYKGMAKRLDRMQVVTDSMVLELEKALNLFQTSCELNDLERADLILELAPKIDKLNTSVIKQLNFLSSQLKQVTISQQGMVYNDEKVKEEMDRLQPIRLQILEENGEIAIINRNLIQ